jgi:pyruvate dehydrogenase complex dehydrogenase (E1) component
MAFARRFRWVSTAPFGAPVVPLGADSFGQVGTRAELYRELLIDAESIVNAALLALEIGEEGE